MIRKPFGLARGELVGSDDLQPMFGQRLTQHHPFRLLRHDQRVGLQRDRVELLGRGQPVGGQILDPAQLLALQARHPGHEEFVDVRARDRQEAEPLEQRMRDVGRFLEHPAVERQPRQFAIEIATSGWPRLAHAAPR